MSEKKNEKSGVLWNHYINPSNTESVKKHFDNLEEERKKGNEYQWGGRILLLRVFLTLQTKPV